jgi:hypothetical protein
MADIRIKDLADGSGVIDDTDYLVMDSAADGTRRVTVAELRTVLGGLQEAYEVAPTIAVTTAEGSVALTNAADVTDLLSLSRTFAGAGRLLNGTMGASSTGDAMRVQVLGTGRGLLLEMDNGGVGVEVENTLSGDGVKVSEFGLTGYGGNNELGITTEQPAATFDARDIDITGGTGGAGTGGSASGDGATVTITAGAAGADGGAGRGAAGKVVINAGDGPTDGDIEIGLANTALVTVNPTAITLAASGGVARLQSSQASLGAVVLEAVSASGSIRCDIAGTETLRVESGQVLHHVGSIAAPGVSFLGDDDTGLRRFGADSIGVVLGGFEYWIFQGGILYGNFTTALTIAALNSNTPVQLRGLTTTAAQASITLDNSGTSLTGSAGTQKQVRVAATLNQSATAAFTLIEGETTETAVGSGTQRLLDLRTTADGSRFSVSNKGVAKAVELQSVQWVEKAADETVVSSDTLQDDDHLFVNLLAGGIYHFRFHLMVSIENDTPAYGIKVALDGTAGVTALRATASYGDTVTGTVVAPNGPITAFASAQGYNFPAGEHWVELEGAIEVSTAGTFRLRWAQNVSDADDTIVKRCSSLVVHRMN